MAFIGKLAGLVEVVNLGPKENSKENPTINLLYGDYSDDDSNEE